MPHKTAKLVRHAELACDGFSVSNGVFSSYTVASGRVHSTQSTIISTSCVGVDFLAARHLPPLSSMAIVIYPLASTGDNHDANARLPQTYHLNIHLRYKSMVTT